MKPDGLFHTITSQVNDVDVKISHPKEWNDSTMGADIAGACGQLVVENQNDQLENSNVDIEDAVIGLRVVSGETPLRAAYRAADMNNDGKIGMAEVIYILQRISGLQ